MSSDSVGLLFSLIVLAYWAAPKARAEHARRVARRDECRRVGHQWGEPFGSSYGRHRNCRRCKRQEHWHADTETWL